MQQIEADFFNRMTAPMQSGDEIAGTLFHFAASPERRMTLERIVRYCRKVVGAG
jgi:hypothetical protein